MWREAKFADCAAEMGGGTYQQLGRTGSRCQQNFGIGQLRFLFMFGILYIGQIERARKMMDLADRAHKFLTVSARQSRPLTPLEG
ncbi:unnamed protein product [Effrenium voratum]|uniref:Uncharacterized protein n=1 Tax=Effrenium voratum TaxID=2562239 RepID=A0AA36I2Y5_9DINO|nr:unnamed protein product [Effrenium voratum]